MTGRGEKRFQGDLSTPSQALFILKSACSQPYHSSAFLEAVNLHPSRQEGLKDTAVKC